MGTKLYTKKEVIAAHPEYKRLINATYKGLHIEKGEESRITDVTEHGMSAGFGSFIYTVDTHAFAMKHRKAIVKLLEEQAEEFDQEVVEMVSGFGQYRSNAMDKDDRKDLYKYLGGGKLEWNNNITNLMCWFAVEEVCRWFINESDY